MSYVLCLSPSLSHSQPAPRDAILIQWQNTSLCPLPSGRSHMKDTASCPSHRAVCWCRFSPQTWPPPNTRETQAVVFFLWLVFGEAGECCSSLASRSEAGMWWSSESHWCNSADFVTWLTSLLLCITVLLAYSYTLVSLSGLEEVWVTRQVLLFPSSLKRVQKVSFCNAKVFNLWNLPLQQKYWQRHWMNFGFHCYYL